MKPGAACIVALAALLPTPAAAQCGGFLEEPCPLDAPRWVGEFTSLSANALLGGVTAGVLQRIRGGSFPRAFVRGALGGSAVYAGKRIAAERFAGAGLLGREAAAVGLSIVRNAADAVPVLDRLVLPAGPVRLYVRPGARAVHAKLDALAFGWMLYGIAEPELSFDWSESLSAGAPVFFTDGTVIRTGADSAHAAGITESGVILVAGVPAFGPSFRARSLAHERVHVLQGDQVFAQWTDPLEDALLPGLPYGRTFDRYVDVGLSTGVLQLLGVLFPDYENRPWELEARFFAR